MRLAFAAVILFGTALVSAQPPKDPPKDAPKKDEKKGAPKDPDEPPPKDVGKRYGVAPRVKAYPAGTPKEALRSAIAAIDRGDYTYLAGQLLDPKFVDGAVVERGLTFEKQTAAELTQLREFQRANPEQVSDDDRVPRDPGAFAALVTLRARDRAFQQLARDLGQRLRDDPQLVKDMRRVARDGSFADADPAATATHPDLKGRSLYFKRYGERWFIENRNSSEEPKP